MSATSAAQAQEQKPHSNHGSRDERDGYKIKKASFIRRICKGVLLLHAIFSVCLLKMNPLLVIAAFALALAGVDGGATGIAHTPELPCCVDSSCGCCPMESTPDDSSSCHCTLTPGEPAGNPPSVPPQQTPPPPSLDSYATDSPGTFSPPSPSARTSQGARIQNVGPPGHVPAYISLCTLLI